MSEKSEFIIRAGEAPDIPLFEIIHRVSLREKMSVKRLRGENSSPGHVPTYRLRNSGPSFKAPHVVLLQCLFATASCFALGLFSI
jgi:hypothetical protein